ncbi:SRPBCC domain-containing protein [Terriglobus tenax]|uniref:SRPBCC domain-containing protein n=1 Tax=Terriglobus tenax TaxID=1111115 RepID=UPI0021DFDD73|nr:SRPBCC domain-containing protein [Terriglobus tenax]
MMTATKVGKSTIEILNETSLLVTRRFQAPRSMVFQAMTVPDLLRQWMLGPDGWTMEACEIDLRPGGNFRFYWTNPDGRELQMTGSYLTVDPPNSFSSTRRFDLGFLSPEEKMHCVLAEDGDATLMRAELVYESQAIRDQALLSGMTKGMESSYERIDQMLKR